MSPALQSRSHLKDCHSLDSLAPREKRGGSVLVHTHPQTDLLEFAGREAADASDM